MHGCYEEYLEEIKEIPLFNFNDKKQYAVEFFKVMHTAKWKATLEDYADLNKRYISLSDIVIFDDPLSAVDLISPPQKAQKRSCASALFPQALQTNISCCSTRTPHLGQNKTPFSGRV